MATAQQINVIPFKQGQDYIQLRESCYREGKLWEDPTFPMDKPVAGNGIMRPYVNSRYSLFFCFSLNLHSSRKISNPMFYYQF